ncbi:MAG: hypothetical protein EBQ92_06540 [Proteobacteria bacterium]|nr:hypothetical protein [Pseudomonadota bacterium]
MSARKLPFLFCFYLILSLSACAIKRPTPDFKPFQDLENVDSSPVQTDSDTRMEFPITPGAAAGNSESSFAKKPGITLVLGGAGVASFATVGLLKRLKKEGVKIDLIVATGWPAVFALGYGFFKSVHDLEWFAMRLQSEDFEKACKLKKGEDEGELSKLIESFLKKKDLRDSQTPVILVVGNTEKEKQGVFDSGEWVEPILKTLAVPGLYRSFPEQESSSLQAFDLQALGVSEAKKRGAYPVFAVQMYSDYIGFSKSAKESPKKPTIRNVFLASLRKNIREELAQAEGAFQVELKASPLDFSQKRAAILAGSVQAAQILKRIGQK